MQTIFLVLLIFIPSSWEYSVMKGKGLKRKKQKEKNYD